MSSYKGRTADENKGKVVYNVSIVKGIVKLAVENVDGVVIRGKNKLANKNTDDIKVETVNGAINVKVSVDVYYGYSVPDVAYNIQQNIKHNVESMSKYKIGDIDVNVNGIIFPEENMD